MQLRYDEEFVEAAVFVRAASRSPQGVPLLQVRRFHHERERLYSILDPEERNEAFFKLHLEWFREWGLERALLAVAGQFPLLSVHLTALVFRKARVRNDEGVELYVNPEQGRSAVAALRAERFEDIDGTGAFLRHEFMHIHDMLNPAFGYSPELGLPKQHAVQQRLTRERYRLLWDITIDGRLGHTDDGAVSDTRRQTGGRDGSTVQARHRAAFDGTFDFWPEQRRCSVFDDLWNNPDPCHDLLLAIASDPRDLSLASKPSPGAPCPLCGFGTFSWVDPGGFEQSIIAEIHKEFSQWLPEQGACRRCVEIYGLLRPKSLQTA